MTERRAGDESPRVLFVDSSYPTDPLAFRAFADEALDYRVYERVPAWWRRLERLTGMDLYLSLKARRLARDFDVVVTGSERVGMPLAVMGVGRPLVTLVYGMASRKKRYLSRLLGFPGRWARVGFLTYADRDFLASTFGYPETRTFRYVAAPLDLFSVTARVDDGPILGAGVVARDYDTLVAALEGLPDCTAEVFASSRYADRYRKKLPLSGRQQVRFVEPTSYSDMPARYARARFVVVPLVKTAQFSAGFSAALEAFAAGKAVIGSDTPGMRECVIHGETGLLVPSGDVGALRHAIDRLWRDPDLAFAMGRAGRRFVEQHFDQQRPQDAIRGAILSAHRERASGRPQSGGRR